MKPNFKELLLLGCWSDILRSLDERRHRGHSSQCSDVKTLHILFDLFDFLLYILNRYNIFVCSFGVGAIFFVMMLKLGLFQDN